MPTETLTVRFRMPTGPGEVTLEENATVGQLFEAIEKQTEGKVATIKYGWPTASLTFAADAGTTVDSLKLQRERLTIVLSEKSEPESGRNPPNEHDPPTVRLPTGNDLVLRVMADDNSCMYTAMMPIIRNSAQERGIDVSTAGALRQVIGQQILSQPEIYNAAVLEKAPGAYVDNLLNPQSWGGSIELNVLSELFDIEICIVSVSSGSVIYQGEGQHDRRCAILWSGIHYDRVVETLFAGAADTGDTEFDVCTWDCATSDHILKGALEMAAILKENNYAHDSNAAVYSCKQCGWVGQGEKELIKHCQATGHSEIQTIEDK
ncbi:ubiquitin thioesterase-like protein OTU1 [Apiospora kogelbergensis]|uniref:Ubiquitin thioesterase OTU n=1 Tax=Apiospora kogelbergensis TaxID=1337665 RepID=A0AAW0R4D1_9PEZI